MWAKSSGMAAGLANARPQAAQNLQMPQPRQCSPYQAVTSKIYRLKQHFLPFATA